MSELRQQAASRHRSSLKAFSAEAWSALSAAMARSSIALPSAGDANWISAKDATVQTMVGPKAARLRARSDAL
jgi:hypothetical protein